MSKNVEINQSTKEIITEFIPETYEWNKKGGEYLLVDYTEIVENNYSLNDKSYIKKTINIKKGFDLIKLGYMRTYKQIKWRKAGDAVEKDNYRFYTSSEIIKQCGFLDFNEELCLILGKGGKCSLFLDNAFSCSADNFVCATDYDDLTTYIYYHNKINWEKIIECNYCGTTLKTYQ